MELIAFTSHLLTDIIPFDSEAPNLADNSTRGEEVFQRSTDPYIGGLRQYCSDAI